MRFLPLLVAIASSAGCSCTPELPPEVKAEIKRDEARRERKRNAFEQEQQPLWDRKAESLSDAELTTELEKCEAAIQENRPSPYFWEFERPELARARESILRSQFTSIQSKNKKDVPLANNVEWARNSCYFKGAGFERTDLEGGTFYSSSY